MLTQFLDPIEIERIHKVSIPPAQVQDQQVWFLANNGELSTKSAYWFGFHLDQLCQDIATSSTNAKIPSSSWNQIWHTNVLHRLSIWAWQASHNRLPTSLNLFKKKIHNITMCFYYESTEESMSHKFYNCKFALETRLHLHMNVDLDVVITWNNLLKSKGLFNLWTEIFTCWKLWLAKSKRLFCNTQLTLYAVVVDIMASLQA